MIAYPVRGSFQGYPQQFGMYQSRPHQTDGSIPSSNTYTGFALPAHPSQTQQNPQSLQQAHPPRSSQPSPSAEEVNKPSLPSISNLLGIADGDRPSQENTSQPHSRAQQAQTQAQPIQVDQRRHLTSYPSHDNLSASQRTVIPPTPPLRNDSVVGGTQSPSTISSGSSLSNQPQPYFMGSINNVEADQQRVIQANFIKRHSVPSQPNTSPYGASPYTTSPYGNSPGALSNGSYYSPNTTTAVDANGNTNSTSYHVSNLYHQRPLPSNFPPPPPPGGPVQSIAISQLPTPNPWEHHHYISPSSQATFPQTQDRYICQTCNKAFSRPSSLKIHSHSHTGEKPFKCPHSGCGKAFSVRSNMKRHERGCHSGLGGMGGSAGHLG